MNEQKQSWFERNPKKAGMLLGAISVIIVIYLFEFALSFSGNNKYNYKFYKILSNRSIRLKEWKPGMDQEITQKDAFDPNNSEYPFYGKTVHVVTDQDGFLSGEKVKNHEQADLKIAFLGASTTECLMVEEELRFPNRVKLQLEKELTKKVNIYNTGISGTYSALSVNQLYNKIVKYAPNYAVFYYCSNDLNYLLETGNYFTGSSNFYSLLQKPETDKLPYFKYTDVFIQPYLNAIKKRIGMSYNQEDYERISNIDSIPIEKYKSYFRNNLRTFINICRAWNVTPVLMTEPSRFSPDSTDLSLAPGKIYGIPQTQWTRWVMDFNDIIRETARQENIPLVELEKTVPKTRKYIYDALHLTADGSKMVADEILKVLLADIQAEPVHQNDSLAVH